MQKFQRSIKMLDQRCPAFYPVAVIAIQNTVNVAHLGTVNVPAHHALVATASRFIRDRYFEISNIVQGSLYLLFEVLRQSPVRQPQADAQAVQVAI